MRILLVILGLVACAMAWQHLRYLKARRGAVQDRQSLLHPASSFHVITFLETAEGAEVVPEVANLRRQIETPSGGKLIYAGQAAFTVASNRLGPAEWDAVILVEYPSRESYEVAARTPAYRDALASFARTYSHGMKRSRLLSLALPQFLLGLRLVDLVKGNLRAQPLEPLPEPAAIPAEFGLLKDRIGQLRDLAPVNSEAVVIFNLMQPGDAQQQAANRSYGFKMMTRMAALAHGPIHVGRAVTLDGAVDFQEVAIVYYPGVEYFAELVGSRFFLGIIGNKQLGDTVSVPTVPILSRL
jgi:hypothetical protein